MHSPTALLFEALSAHTVHELTLADVHSLQSPVQDLQDSVGMSKNSPGLHCNFSTQPMPYLK